MTRRSQIVNETMKRTTPYYGVRERLRTFTRRNKTQSIENKILNNAMKKKQSQILKRYKKLMKR